MNTIHIVSGVQIEASGPSYCVLRTCEELRALGTQAQIASLDWIPGKPCPDEVHLFPLGLGPRRLGRSPAMHRWLREQVNSENVDIIHNHGLWMMPNIYAGLVASGSACQLLVSPHGTFADWALGRSGFRKRLFHRLLQAPALACAACFHATSEAEYRDIRKQGYRQPVAVIPFGIDIPEFMPRHARERRKLLFLGRLHPVKGVELLLRAWGTVSKRFPEWDLEIAGPGEVSYVRQLQEMAQSLHLQRVVFRGAVYGDEKRDCFHESDLFVLPTYTENFGIAVAEALAAGIPAITTHGAPWGGLTQHDAGWWVDIGVDPLVACLEDALARSSSDLAEMGLRGRDWMAAEYSWPHVGQQMAETYRWILQGGNKPEWVIEE